jgi:HlyD family secretion protein
VTVEKGDVNVLITTTGVMAADTSVDVGVQVSGSIAALKADFNSIVTKGQVIAVLDTTLYYTAKQDASAVLQRMQVAFDQTQSELNRNKKLLEEKVIAQAEYDITRTAYENAKGNIISAQAQLKRAAINLKYCTVTAPISGTVIARNVQVGNMVIASFNSPVLFTIANNLTKMQLQANVDEADIGQVKIGQEAKFTVDTYPNDVFTGIVAQVRHQPVTVLNVINYVVIIEVSNPDLKLLPGLTANANIYIQQRKNVLRVATSAFSFTPPIAYIQASPFLADSTKAFWAKKILAASQLKKQEIVETIDTLGYLWAVKDKDVFPIQVIKGLNDGSFTEVNGEIKEGYVIATGINQAENKADSKSTKSPFMPTMPSRKKK